MTLLYIRTLQILPEEDLEERRPPPSNDVYKETRRVTEPIRAHSRPWHISDVSLTHNGPTHVCRHLSLPR
jgi:hypothetical protein